VPARLVATLLTAAAVLVLAPAADAGSPLVRTWKIHYRDHAGDRRAAYVVLPAAYGPRHHPGRIPLIVSPHGRGIDGRANARLWGALPARGGFAVVSPDGVSRYSWGAAGQISDLARMPEIVRRTLPWLRIDGRRIYAFGGSMGGQETLLLLARHPGLLAGAAAFDSVTDFARQYRSFPRLGCSKVCRKAWKGPIGPGLQSLARQLIGGSPRTAPRRYALRSPATYAKKIARSCVPLQLWWSVADRIVLDQQRQSGSFFWTLRRLNPDAPVSAYVGTWIHSHEMQAKSELPVALAEFGLLPPRLDALSMRHVPAPATSDSCGSR
jgi:pimeloyl-ACP methyl ester carboxylesterase